MKSKTINLDNIIRFEKLQVVTTSHRHRFCLRKKHSEDKTSLSELKGISLTETEAYII